MLKIQEIREIIKLIDQSSIEKFTFESEGTKIKLEKAVNSTQNPLTQNQSEMKRPVQQKTPAVQEKKQEQSEQAPAEKESNEPTSGSSTRGRSIIAQNHVTDGRHILYSHHHQKQIHMLQKVIPLNRNQSFAS